MNPVPGKLFPTSSLSSKSAPRERRYRVFPNGSRSGRRWDAQLAEDVAVQPHTVLLDQSPPLARARDAHAHEEPRDVDGAVLDVRRLEGELGDVLGRLALPHRSVEVLLRERRDVGSVVA